MAIKSGQLKELKDYQAYILEMLETNNDYKIRQADDYDAVYGMDVELLFDFLNDTQSDKYQFSETA